MPGAEKGESRSRARPASACPRPQPLRVPGPATGAARHKGRHGNGARAPAAPRRQRSISPRSAHRPRAPRLLPETPPSGVSRSSSLRLCHGWLLAANVELEELDYRLALQPVLTIIAYSVQTVRKEPFCAGRDPFPSLNHSGQAPAVLCQPAVGSHKISVHISAAFSLNVTVRLGSFLFDVSRHGMCMLKGNGLKGKKQTTRWPRLYRFLQKVNSKSLHRLRGQAGIASQNS